MNNSEKIWSALVNNQVDKVAFNPCNKLNLVMSYKPDDLELWDITKESAGLPDRAFAWCIAQSLNCQYRYFE